MAKSVSIETRENAVKIIVDGNEINDVLSYVLSEDESGAVLTLRISITEEVEAWIE